MHSNFEKKWLHALKRLPQPAQPHPQILALPGLNASTGPQTCILLAGSGGNHPQRPACSPRTQALSPQRDARTGNSNGRPGSAGGGPQTRGIGVPGPSCSCSFSSRCCQQQQQPSQHQHQQQQQQHTCGGCEGAPNLRPVLRALCTLARAHVQPPVLRRLPAQAAAAGGPQQQTDLPHLQHGPARRPRALPGHGQGRGGHRAQPAAGPAAALQQALQGRPDRCRPDQQDALVADPTQHGRRPPGSSRRGGRRGPAHANRRPALCSRRQHARRRVWGHQCQHGHGSCQQQPIHVGSPGPQGQQRPASALCSPGSSSSSRRALWPRGAVPVRPPGCWAGPPPPPPPKPRGAEPCAADGHGSADGAGTGGRAQDALAQRASGCSCSRCGSRGQHAQPWRLHARGGQPAARAPQPAGPRSGSGCSRAGRWPPGWRAPAPTPGLCAQRPAAAAEQPDGQHVPGLSSICCGVFVCCGACCCCCYMCVHSDPHQCGAGVCQELSAGVVCGCCRRSPLVELASCVGGVLPRHVGGGSLDHFMCCAVCGTVEGARSCKSVSQPLSLL